MEFVNAKIKGLGETVLRVKNINQMTDFYTKVIGLELIKEFDGISFLKIGEGYEGHTQIIGLFHEEMPVAFEDLPRGPVKVESTSLHHFALEISKEDYDSELDRLRSLEVPTTTATHGWCHWRSIYVTDPEGNIVELVCHDETAS